MEWKMKAIDKSLKEKIDDLKEALSTGTLPELNEVPLDGCLSSSSSGGGYSAPVRE
jgi:hypothetical protein